jgi:hypothetical protein
VPRQVREIRQQLLEIMKSRNLAHVSCGTNWDVVRKCICSAFFHKVEAMRIRSQEEKNKNEEGRKEKKEENDKRRRSSMNCLMLRHQSLIFPLRFSHSFFLLCFS